MYYYLFRHFYCLLSIYHDTVSFSCKCLLTAETLQTVRAKVFSVLAFCFVIHEHLEIFDEYIMLVFSWYVDWKGLFFFITKYIYVDVILLLNFIVLLHRFWKFNVWVIQLVNIFLFLFLFSLRYFLVDSYVWCDFIGNICCH